MKHFLSVCASLKNRRAQERTIQMSRFIPICYHKPYFSITIICREKILHISDCISPTERSDDALNDFLMLRAHHIAKLHFTLFHEISQMRGYRTLCERTLLCNLLHTLSLAIERSEERRVGKECRS